MIALGTSGILISNEKDINGEWLWTTAIDSQGLSTKIVNAITINGAQVNAGKISSFDGNSWWNLDNNEFNFGDKIKFIDGTFSIELGNGLENLVTKEDLEEVKDLIEDVDGRLDTALGDIDRAFKEGIIGEVEKRVIEKTLKTLLDQYSNAEYLYEIYKVSENLADETKTTLNARWRLYDASYTELTNYINEIIADEKCTETELASYNLKVEEYYARYSELKNLLEDCQIEASNNYTNTKVSISEGNIKTEIESKYVKVDEAVNYTVICDNEHQGIPVDMLRKPLTTNTYRFNIAIYKGGAGTQQEFTIDSITGTGSGITYTKYDKYITMKVSKDTAISDLEGSIDVALTCNGFKFNKKITWNAVLNGEKGDSAEVVFIEASSLIFKYNNETQVYSPTNITLNPVFKNCAFQSWKYSINGGITYNTLATIDGITKDTNNKLTISSTCALFTSSVTSIQFKVTSSVGTTDQVTLTRLRDGLDGLDGLAGEKGADGKTYYTWVKYADTPTSGMSELPDGKTYIGLAYNKETNVESTNYADYKWSLIKGENGLDGEKGEDGKTYYTWLKYADTPTSGMSDDPTNKKYMGLAYNKESKIESTNYADYSWSLIKGNDGTNAINVVLSNESHTFVADHYGCPIPTSITNNVYGYSGTKQVNTNIGEIIGLPEGMSITVKNNNTTNTQIIINVAETMRIESGTISIPVICNGVTINKVFTYSLAKNGVDAKIVVINATSQVFKSTDGGINYTPNSITVIASYQNCSHSKWQYSTNNDLTFRDLTNGTGGITVNGTTLTIPKTCSLFTSTTNCINIKAIGVDENVYDTVTIFKLLDRADINDVLDEQNSKITTVEEKYSTLEQDLNGFKTEVGQKYTTLEEFGQLEVGATNLIRNANFDLGLDVYWTTVGVGSQSNLITLLSPEDDKPTSNILSYNVSGKTSPTSIYKLSNPIPIEWDENGVAEFIFRFEIKSEDWSVVASNGILCVIRTFVDSDKIAGTDCVEEFYVRKSDIDTTNNDWQTIVKRIKLTNNTAKYIRFGSYCSQNSNCKFREFMAVKGNRIASTFSINPSDNKEYVDGEIEDYTQTITREYQSAIEQTKNDITLSVSETYATKTEIEQMVIGGGDNLLRNGNFADGLDHWTIEDYDTAGTSKSIAVINTPSQWIPKNKSVLRIIGLNTNERYGVGSDIMKLAPYTKYVISGYCAGHRINEIKVFMRDVDNGHTSIVVKDISPVVGGDNLNNWTRFEIPFTTTANGNYKLNLYSGVYNNDGSGLASSVWFTDVQVEQGDKATPWKMCIYDVTDGIDDVSNSVTNLNTYIDGALQDKILDETERQAIEQQLKVLEAEKADINKEYTALNSNAKLTGTPKTTLTSAYNDYIAKYNSLVTSVNNILNAENITVALKNSYNTAYTNHNNSLATYRQAYIDAFNTITTNYIETMKQALLEEIDDVQSSIDTLNTYVDGAFKDGILDNAEKHAIKQQLKTLSAEKADIDNEYAVVINDSDLTGTPKTNLTNAYNDYVSKYNSLVTSINNILNATLVTPTLRNSYDTAYTNHNSALATLKQRHVEAIDAIAETKKQSSITTSKNYTDAQLTITADAIRGTVSQLREDFDNLEIGGENLIKNSEFVNTSMWYISNSNVSIDTSMRCFDSNSMKISVSGLTSVAYTSFDQTFATNVVSGQKYTISGYYYVDNASLLDGAFAIELKSKKGSEYTGLNSVGFDKTTCEVKKWTKFSFTTTLNQDYDSIFLTVWLSKNGTVWFSRLQVERGDRATDYSPASTTYATKSEMELTSEEFKLTFQTSGSGNLLKNSDCQFGLNGQWVSNGGGLDRDMSNAKPFLGSREPFFKTTFPQGFKYSETVYLKPNTDYVYQAYVYVGSNITTDSRSPVHFWSWVANAGTSPTSGQAGVTIIDYKQDVAVGVFKLCYVHFKTENISASIGFLPFIYNEGTSVVAVKQICLKEGKTPSIWIPHSSEINEGITTINEHGIQVSHSNIKTKTRMTADGFYFLDENDDMFASLSSKDTWASLRVQEVFANNIENVYTGTSTLYVNHSKTVAGDGSSSSPFNSFGVLKEYLESMPIINKDLDIYVQNPNMEINEQLSLSNLKGTGWIKIVFDKNCVLRSSEWAIVLNGINKFTIIEGGRSSYDSSDGAVILDKGNQHGISINDCKDVYIHSININCKNWGIRANKSKLRTRNVDFGQTWCAIQLDENCMGYDGDSCGNCGDFVRAVTGSIFTYGSSGNGICPFGNKLENSGKILLVGNARTQRGSYKYPSSSSTPSTPATSTYTQTFKATSFKTYQYAWSNWGDGQAGGAIQGAYGG